MRPKTFEMKCPWCKHTWRARYATTKTEFMNCPKRDCNWGAPRPQFFGSDVHKLGNKKEETQ